MTHYGNNATASFNGIKLGAVLSGLMLQCHSRVWEQVEARVFPSCTCDDPLCELRPSIIHDFDDWFADAKRRALGLPRTFIEVGQKPFSMKDMADAMAEDFRKRTEEEFCKWQERPFRFIAWDMPVVSPKWSMLLSSA